MTDPLAAALERLWQTNRSVILARGERVLLALEAAAEDRPFDRAGTAGEAHALAGALGTYGRPGSELFAELERTLATGSEPMPDADAFATRVRAALRALT